MKYLLLKGLQGMDEVDSGSVQDESKPDEEYQEVFLFKPAIWEKSQG